MIVRIIFFLIFPLAFTSLYAQEPPPPRPSPLALATARYKDTYLKITYGQPQKNGREVFGKLVPYGQVWRTGANEATEITVTQDVIINGVVLKAGTYSVFTIPDKEHWTIIINSDVGQWGSYNYNIKLDVMRFDVPVHSLENEICESFTISIDQKNEKADILMVWDKTKVIVSVRFNEPKSP